MRKRPISKSRFTPSSARRMSFKMNQVAEDDGGIALLGLHDGGSQRGLHQALDMAKYFGMAGDQVSILPFEVAAVGEARKERLM